MPFVDTFKSSAILFIPGVSMELDSGLTTVQLLVYCILEDYVMCILAMLAMTAMFVPFFQLDQVLGFELSSLENSSFYD
jgi:hypothetical protein